MFRIRTISSGRLFLPHASFPYFNILPLTPVTVSELTKTNS